MGIVILFRWDEASNKWKVSFNQGAWIVAGNSKEAAEFASQVSGKQVQEPRLPRLH